MSPLKRQSACHHVIVTLNTRKGWWPYLRCLLVATPCSAFVPSSGANNRRKDGAIFNSSNVLDKATSKRMELLFASAATTTAVVSNGSTARLQLPSSCATGGPGLGARFGFFFLPKRAKIPVKFLPPSAGAAEPGARGGPGRGA